MSSFVKVNLVIFYILTKLNARKSFSVDAAVVVRKGFTDAGRCGILEKISNLIPVGRMLNADRGAFGALRVMVNLNQLGEAAGVAAYLSVDSQTSIQNICGKSVQKELQKDF